MSSVDRWIETLLEGQIITQSEVEELCATASELLRNEPNIVHVSAPVTLVGDIHGQFFDLKEIFIIAGPAKDTDYIFLGDYVDRGYHSVETFLLLIALKVRYPHNVHLLRGNHESRQVTQVYGFYDECIRKFGLSTVWRLCTEVFDCLPLACVVSNRIFCVHGGLSPDIASAGGGCAPPPPPPAAIERSPFPIPTDFSNVPGSSSHLQINSPYGPFGGNGVFSVTAPTDGRTLSSATLHHPAPPILPSLGPLAALDRFQEVPKDGLFADLLWSDPEGDITGWSASVRGAGHLFGRDVVESFLSVNSLSVIYRAHQLVMEGWKSMFSDKLYTVWSAPNYCYRCGNTAAVADLDEQCVPQMRLFEASTVSRAVPDYAIRSSVPDYFM